MKNVLIIGPKIYPVDNANTAIIKKMIEEMNSNNSYKISYISLNQGKDTFTDSKINIYSVEETLFSKIYNRLVQRTDKFSRLLITSLIMLRRISQVFSIRSYPDVDPKQTRKTVEVAEKLLKEESFDVVISVFRPFTSVSTLSILQKKYGNFTSIVIYLDVLKGGSTPKIVKKLGLSNYLDEKESKILSCFDRVYIPSNSKFDYQINGKGGTNFEFYEFPTFDIDDYVDVQNKMHTKMSCDNSKILRLSYAGLLDENYRNPQKMLNYLNSYARKGNRVHLDLMGKCDCLNIFDSFAFSENFEIQIHGQVSEKTVKEIQLKSAILINISNKGLNMIPSKIFRLFSTGKPIINFYFDSRDPALKYFNKYPRSISLNEESNLDYSFLNQVQENKLPIISRQYLVDTFGNHSISYFTKNIVELINEK